MKWSMEKIEVGWALSLSKLRDALICEARPECGAGGAAIETQDCITLCFLWTGGIRD
jgi:hypothetical protein